MTTPESLLSRTSYSYWAFSLVALLAVTAATAQIAIDASGNYEQEVQSCRSGKTPQTKATCLEEALNAQADKKQSKNTLKADLEANAMTRCDPLAVDDKVACRARMMGQGSSSGSVAGGGILRTFTSVETRKRRPPPRNVKRLRPLLYALNPVVTQAKALTRPINTGWCSR